MKLIGRNFVFASGLFCATAFGLMSCNNVEKEEITTEENNSDSNTSDESAEVMKIDQLLAGFAFDTDYYDNTYFDSIITFEAKADSLIAQSDIFQGKSCLKLVAIDDSEDSNGYILLTEEQVENLDFKKLFGNKLLVTSKIQSLYFGGKYGVDLFFGEGEIIEIN
ncbi:MAG: hypothetical protein H6600_08430 [Flavobacteriales bacterium]|nr:hypothetical protein [Flavobacteriales bacterium]MCB9198471.1 hypothetical protein [Flavobacteriales bacterium]